MTNRRYLTSPLPEAEFRNTATDNGNTGDTGLGVAESPSAWKELWG